MRFKHNKRPLQDNGLWRSASIVSGTQLLGAALSLVLMAFSVSALAEAPNAGQLLQQTTPKPTVPQAGGSIPLIIPKKGEMPTDTTPLPVKQVVFKGNTVFTNAELQNVIAPALQSGQPISLKRLAEMAKQVTDYYRQHGYMLSRAFVPAQTLNGKEVTLQIVEARYGKVTVTNNSLVKDDRVNSFVANLHQGDLISQDRLYRDLMLLNQLPGAKLGSQIEPGSHPGEADLNIKVDEAPFVDGQVALDNYGSRATGRTRGSATINLENPMHWGDQLGVDLLTSGKGMYYIRFRYSLPVNGLGTRVGASYSYLHYELMHHHTSHLHAKGDANVASLWAKHPLILNNRTRVNVRLQGFHKSFTDKVRFFADNERDVDSVLLAFAGSHKDAFWKGGITGASLSGTFGRVSFNNTVAEAVDAAGIDTQGSYSVFRASLYRLQTLSERTRLYAGINGQTSSDNLDSSERFQLGGANNIPGYELSILSGSKGYKATLALRHDLPLLPPGRWVGAIFTDAGHTTIYANPFPLSGKNEAEIYDAGLGLFWNGPDNWSGKAQLARAIGRHTVFASGHRTKIHAWLRIVKKF